MAGFGELLRARRHAAGLTMEELAERSGVSARAISDMERGHSRGPQHRTLEALADALGVTAAERDDLITAAKAGRRRPTTPPPGGCDLPRGAADFTGRAAELAVLSGQDGITVVSGAPGLGKTSLAVHAARLGDHPDGRFFVDLRGLDAEPVPPADVLARLLKALGTPERRIPQDTEERAGLFRTAVTGRRCVVVLDNATDEAHVRPLLPNPGDVRVLITSRRTLSGLEAVHRLPLAPLPPAESAELLRVITGRAGVDVARVAELCGHLPLALRIAANRLLSRPGWTVAHLAGRLGDEERRLAALTAGDLRVGPAFALSYRQLSAPARRVFRRLGLIAGPDTGVPLAAVLAQHGLDETDDALEELVDLGLLQSFVAGRYLFHDLIRLFARERLADEESPAELDAARTRMHDWLLENALRAGRCFEPDHGAPTDTRQDLVALATPADAQLWLETESPHWLAALRAVAAGGAHRLVVDVAEAMHWFSDRFTHWTHWTEVYRLSYEAAKELGDRSLTVVHLNYLAWALSMCAGRHQDSVDHALEAFELARADGDARQQAWALDYAARAHWKLADTELAVAEASRAAELFEQAGDRDGRPQSLALLGRVLREAGRHEEAIALFRDMIDSMRDPERAPSPVVARMTEAYARMWIGEGQLALDRPAEATATLREAVPLLREYGRPQGVAGVQEALGRALLALGETAQAREALHEAAGLWAGVGEHDRAREAVALLD